MSKLLILHKHGYVLSTEAPHVPRVGEKIAKSHRPYPTVKEVINFPEDQDINPLVKGNKQIFKFEYYDAIILCE